MFAGGFALAGGQARVRIPPAVIPRNGFLLRVPPHAGLPGSPAYDRVYG
jgi:hypothetical protein